MSRFFGARSKSGDSRRTEEILDTCLEDMRARHVSAADCLRQHGANSPELASLLEIAEELEGLPDIRPSVEFKRTTRRVIANLPFAAHQTVSLRTRPNLGKYLPGRRFWMAVMAALIVLLLGSTAIYASKLVLPGTLFYPVKRQVEDVQLALAYDPETRVAVHSQLAEHRLVETEELANVGDIPSAEQTSADYRSEVSAAFAEFHSSQNGNLSTATADEFREQLLQQRQELRGYEASVPAQSKKLIRDAIMFCEKIIEQMATLAPM